MKKKLLFFTLLVLTLSVPVLAKDTWINVRSKNFFLIGNASDKEIRQVATKLEQFREVFRQLFPNAKFTQSIQTNVVVFKSASAYRPFKPKRADGKPDDNIAGYFQPGDDVNYITVSTEGENEDTFGTIFHEYVHYLVNTNFGKTDVPPWFNEGLAEYYQTFKIEDDQKVTLGSLQNGHLQLLQQNKLIPLKTFFEIDNYSLHQNGNHSRSIFYAQAWALLHFLIQGNKGARNDAMSKFLVAVTNRVESEKAFQDAFQMDYAAMEKELRKYVSQNQYYASVATFKQKLLFDAEMKTVSLTEAEANAYLGDLLYHSRRYDDAEPYLQKSLAVDPAQSQANTSLGLVRMRQRKFVEARDMLEKAIAADSKNHMAHYYYAYVLSREGMDEFGYASRFDSGTATKMRESLSRAIALNPNFTESYQLLGFINLVTDFELDQTLEMLKKSLKLQAGNLDAAFMIAQIYARQQKFAEAKEIAERIIKATTEPSMRQRSEQFVKSLDDFAERKAAFEKNVEQNDEVRPIIRRREPGKKMTPEEIAKIEQDNQNLSLNRSVPRPKEGQQQLVGYIQKVACANGQVIYTIKTETETVLLKSKDFAGLELGSIVEKAQNLEFGCNAQVADVKAVLIFNPAADPKTKSRGELVLINFVPDSFRSMSDEELKTARTVYIEQPEEEMESGTTVTQPSSDGEKQPSDDLDKRRRAAMLENIRSNLRKPADGETRALGIVNQIECSNSSITFVSTIGGQTIKLKAKSQKDVKIVAYTPDAGGIQLGCGVKLPPVNAVITYRPKGKEGEIVSIEFVPTSFTLD